MVLNTVSQWHLRTPNVLETSLVREAIRSLRKRKNVRMNRVVYFYHLLWVIFIRMKQLLFPKKITELILLLKLVFLLVYYTEKCSLLTLMIAWWTIEPSKRLFITFLRHRLTETGNGLTEGKLFLFQ